MAEVEDWLLREARRFAAAVRAVVAAREAGDPEQAHVGVEEGLRVVVGLSAPVLARMAPDAVRPLLSVDGGLERDRTLAVAALLLEDAALCRDVGEAYQRRAAALGLLALLAPESDPPPDLIERLLALSRQVHLHVLDGPTLRRLMGAFEAVGRYDRAEDVVFTWLDREPEAAFEAGMALYERLWAVPEARLKAGGLSTDEVLEGMTELQQRLGRA